MSTVHIDNSQPTPDQRYTEDELRWSAWMTQSQKGDERAYEQLLRELSDAISRYLRRRIGAQDFIEDCVQDILIAVHNARHTYQPNRPFRPWLFAIVRNRSVDYFRKRQRHQKLADALETNEEVTSTEDNYANEAMHQQLMDTLPEGSREAIELTKVYGYSNSEAAEQLSISESAVKVRVHRGLNQLKRIVSANFK